MLQQLLDTRHQLVHKLLDLLKGFTRVDTHLLQPGVGQVTQGPQGQRQVFVDHRGRRRGAHLLGNLLPQAAHIADVDQNILGPGAFGCGAQDITAGLIDIFAFLAVGDDLFQALALGFVFDFQRDAHMRCARHVHQITGWDREMRGQARALGANRVFGDLHHQRLALVHQRADRLYRLALALGDFGGVNKGRTFQSDIDKGRLHARQHAHDLALVDIADDATALGALDVHFLQYAVLDQRNAGFHRRDIDENFFAHGLSRFLSVTTIPVIGAPE